MTIPATNNPGLTQKHLDDAMATVTTTPGPKGDRGDDGAPGRDGVDGRHGVDGKDGRDGVDGAPGERGLQGIQGIQGVPGVNGRDGTPAKLTQSVSATTNAAGSYVWTYPTPFPSVPHIFPSILAASDVFDIKVVPPVTTTSCRIQVGRTQIAAVSLLGLSILSVPANVGATNINIIAVEP